MPESIIIEFDIIQRIFKQIPIEELKINNNDESKIYWVHCNLNNPAQLNWATTTLQLPEDVINLCRQNDTMSKLIDSDESITVQLQCLVSTTVTEHAETCFTKLIMHLSTRYCFTASHEEFPALLEFKKSYQKAIRYAKTPCFIFFLIFDNVINDYTKILFNFELITEQLDLTVRSTHQNIYNDIMIIKQEVMKVKRYTIAARDILMRLSGRNISVVSEECRSSLYNLTNHTHMVVHEADSSRDVLNGLLDQIDNSLMQKMNETMRVLTAVAAIFLPLTLITGIYGMNFNWMPELQWEYGYFWALGLIIFCGIAMLIVFKKMKWF